MSGPAVTVSVIVLLAVLVVGLLAIPVRLQLTVRRTDRVRAEFRFIWLFGFVDAAPSDDGAASRTRARPARPQARRRRRPPRVGRVVAVLRSRGLIARVLRLARDLSRRVRVERLALQARFGFDDPADTGQVYGLLYPVLASAHAAGLALDCDPDFDAAVFSGSLTARVRLVPLLVLATATRFLMSPAVARAVMTWRRHR